ncbi:GGDEF domain-containing protein, partial [Aliarcobacter skirrowii]
ILSLLIILYILRVNYIQKNIFIKKAYTDTLTKLFNRSKFNVDLDKIIKEKRFCEYSVIMYDIDFFKKVNDTYGHDIGDIVLQEFSDVTKKAIRATDLVYRWGGEEFIAIIESNSKENLILVAEKMRVAVENFNFTKIGKLTSSFGIAIPKKDDTKDSLLKRADDNLYKAKQTGRNKVVI